MKDHMKRSNREITLAVMVEDLPALAEVDAIAATEGIDIVGVGPPAMPRALGAGGTSRGGRITTVECAHDFVMGCSFKRHRRERYRI